MFSHAGMLEAFRPTPPRAARDDREYDSPLHANAAANVISREANGKYIE